MTGASGGTSPLRTSVMAGLQNDAASPMGSVPAPVICFVLMLQALRWLSGWEAADAATFVLRLKAASGES